MQTTELSSPEQHSPLTSWITPVLFGMNLLLGAIGTVLIFRYGNVSRDTFQEFDLGLSRLTEIALAPYFVFILPALAICGFCIHFFSMKPKTKLIAHSLHFLLIISTTGFFVATTVPVMQRLIQQLR